MGIRTIPLSRLEADPKGTLTECADSGEGFVIELPDNATAEKIREMLGPDGEDLVAHLTATWETVGVLLFHKELSIDIIDDFFSGPILISWRKLLPYVADLRRHYQRETWSEWFQWLAERMIEREKSLPPVPAYVAYRDWRA